MNTINEILQSRFISKNDKPRFINKFLHFAYKYKFIQYYHLLLSYNKRLEAQFLLEFLLEDLTKFYDINKQNN
jgi:hypothetical protein